MSVALQNFVACIILRLLFPLFPLAIVFMYDGDVKLRALTLTASIYALTQGFATNHVATFAITIGCGVLLAASYGATDAMATAMPIYTAKPVWVLVVTIVMLGIERYQRHVQKCEPFFTFANKQEAPRA